ncbi:MAG: 50S ribosomal protein L29 [Gammaproteobacteria bacterium]|nr:50S ribosomal protein L29 [Gammaproteobacteria bacterium]
MKGKDLGAKTVSDLNTLKLELLREQFNLRMQKGTGQLTKNHLFKIARRNLARIETILNQKVGAA